MEYINGCWVPDIDVSTDKIRRSTEQTLKSGGMQVDHLRQALPYVQKWDLAIDGGANIGSWTKILSSRFEKVISIELASDTYECLEKNVNEWGLGNVQCYNRAISDKEEYVGIKDYDIKTSVGRHVCGNGNIKSILIDELQLEALSFLKLDVEGYEEKALLGAVQTIKKFKPVILIEHKPNTWNRYGDPSAAVTFLESLGATLQAKLGRNGIDWLFMFS